MNFSAMSFSFDESIFLDLISSFEFGKTRTLAAASRASSMSSPRTDAFSIAKSRPFFPTGTISSSLRLWRIVIFSEILPFTNFFSLERFSAGLESSENKGRERKMNTEKIEKKLRTFNYHLPLEILINTFCLLSDKQRDYSAFSSFAPSEGSASDS